MALEDVCIMLIEEQLYQYHEPIKGVVADLPPVEQFKTVAALLADMCDEMRGASQPVINAGQDLRAKIIKTLRIIAR